MAKRSRRTGHHSVIFHGMQTRRPSATVTNRASRAFTASLVRDDQLLDLAQATASASAVPRCAGATAPRWRHPHPRKSAPARQPCCRAPSGVGAGSVARCPPGSPAGASSTQRPIRSAAAGRDRATPKRLRQSWPASPMAPVRLRSSIRARRRCEIAGATAPVSRGTCRETEDMTSGSSSEAVMLVPHSQRVGRCRSRAECSSARAANPRSELTTMTYTSRPASVLSLPRLVVQQRAHVADLFRAELAIGHQMGEEQFGHPLRACR